MQYHVVGVSERKTVNQDIPLVMVTKPSSSAQAQHSYAGQVEARQQTALSFRVAGQITERDVDVGIAFVLARYWPNSMSRMRSYSSMQHRHNLIMPVRRHRLPATN